MAARLGNVLFWLGCIVAALVVVADLKANLGHVRYHVKKHAAVIGTRV